MPSPSTIQLLVNGTEDITQNALYAQTRFEVVGSATPGTGRVVLKDPQRVLNFTTGDEVALIVDDVRVWGGLMLDKGEGHFFPAVDTTDLNAVHDLQWQLNLTDYNIYMDKRVVRNTSNYLRVPMVGPGKMGAVLRQAIPNYMDVPPGFDYTTFVDNTNVDWASVDGGPAPLANNVGDTWRHVLDLFALQGGFEWRVDAHKRLHFHALEALESAWGFTDYNPDGVRRIGFREGRIREDGMQMVTDALVWGGHAIQLEDAPVDQAPVFARYPDPPANTQTVRGEVLTAEREQQAINRIAEYGRWQRAEVRIDEVGFFEQQDVTLRAASIVSGPDVGTEEIFGLDVGLNRPVWQVSLSWFAHQVPGKQHIVPGNIVPLTFWTMGDGVNPLVLYLPLRTLSISFPTLPPELPGEDPLTYVRFDGEFGISYSDTRYLWRFLRAKNRNSQTVLSTIGQESSSSVAGALGGFRPIESPDGERTEFTMPHSYLSGTTEVHLNGLLQRPRYEYIESRAAQGKITFAQAPHADDTIWVIMRTGAG